MGDSSADQLVLPPIPSKSVDTMQWLYACGDCMCSRGDCGMKKYGALAGGRSLHPMGACSAKLDMDIATHTHTQHRVARMVQRDCVTVRSCPESTSCCLCCLCSWTGKQVVLYFKDNPWNWPPFATPRAGHPREVHPCCYWTPIMF